MKKLLLLPIIVLSMNTNAQTKFGLKAGLNISNLNIDLETIDSKAGLYAGAYVKINVNEKFVIQPELLFSAQGANDIGILRLGTNNYTKLKRKNNLDYINLPLMFKFFPTRGFNIEAGPQIGFLINAKTHFKHNKNSYSLNINESLKTVDLSLNVGLGYEFKNNVNFTARYNHSLADISKYDGNIKNSVFSFGLGYTFK